MNARVLFAALHLLDHQLIDRDGLLAGNVDVSAGTGFGPDSPTFARK